MKLDLKIFDALNNLPGRLEWLDKLAVFFAKYSVWFLVVFLVYIFLIKRHRDNVRMVATSLMSALIAKGIVVEIIRFFYHRPRPYSGREPEVYILILNDKWSFPSGHAAFMFALAMGVYFYNKTLGTIFLVVSILAGIARIYTGTHWPSDILGGAIIGILIALICSWLLKKYWFKENVSS